MSKILKFISNSIDGIFWKVKYDLLEENQKLLIESNEELRLALTRFVQDSPVHTGTEASKGEIHMAYYDGLKALENAYGWRKLYTEILKKDDCK